MGWYHHELANGQDPFADERKQLESNGGATGCGTRSDSSNSTPATTTTCSDGLCSIRQQQQQQQQKQQQTVVTGGDTPSTTVAMAGKGNQPENEGKEGDVYQENGPVYHLCQKTKWVTAIETQQSYYPPTFWLDGKFTRACCNKDTLIDTANEYYKNTPGDWICLEIDAILLRQCGILVACHYAPELTKEQQPIQCLKIYSGISVHLPNLIHHIYPISRSPTDGTFLTLATKPDPSIPTCCVNVSTRTKTIPKPPPEEAPSLLTKSSTTKTSSISSTITTGKQKKKNGFLGLLRK
jgi:hypothetical protein